MAYTAADRDAVKAALLALATGERTVTIAYADRTETYQPADVAQLQAILAMIETDLGATTRVRQWLASGSKGL